MTIIKDLPKTAYTPNRSRLGRVEVARELERIQKLALADQNDGSRIPVIIGEVTTYWSLGLCKTSPAFLESGTGPSTGVKRLHIYLPNEGVISVYDKRDRNTWERRALLPLTDPERILASLPKKALVPEASTSLATPAQLSVIRKNLDLSTDAALEPMTAASVSRMIDRLTIEKDMVELHADSREWASGPIPE
jgi:hypothetical protein